MKKELFDYHYGMLFEKDGELFLDYLGKVFQITSQPYEPCLYLSVDKKVCSCIHNAFNASEISALAKEGGFITSATGIKYDINRMCYFLAYASQSIADADISYAEKCFAEHMTDYFPCLLDMYYDCIIDYYFYDSIDEYKGEITHRQALEAAIKELIDKYEIEFDYDIQKAEAAIIDSKTLFEVPESLVCENEGKGEKIPYWYAFLNPPNAPYPESFKPSDFERINFALFPNGRNELEAFDWSTDWSDYFDDGKEWWGTICSTVYDKSLKRIVVIMASVTD